MTPITYEDSAKMLGRTEGTLKHAIGRGVFTKLPRQGLYQHLIKEQVELFKNKKRLSLSALSNEERKKWEELRAGAVQKVKIAFTIEDDLITEEAVEQKGYQRGRIFKRGFLEGIADDIPEELLEAEKKSPYPSLTA